MVRVNIRWRERRWLLVAASQGQLLEAGLVVATDLIRFPFERAIEINAFILDHEPGMKGSTDVSKLN